MPNGMLWIVQSGAQWREPPEAYGPWWSVYAQFAKWREKTADKSVDRTRGGLNTKLHAVELLKKVEIRGSGVLTDWAYGARAIRPYISEHGASYVIPPQSNVSDPWPVDWHLYTEHHLVECFFQKIKWFRRIATRYNKLDAWFLVFVYLASIAILLIQHYSLDFSNRAWAVRQLTCRTALIQ